ncbi:uncharacterized protein LOC122954480 [Acropora millepora]|uniref:uncharacterized protein LOC122954480 n=1 Tax=Acropora millepora TaxID=45264 RepID=UPI001CF569EE|nr:uncharacterized protein LOC122954480 [Acropora millepora]
MINNAFPFVIQLNCFMILMIDDYHNIHAKKVPTQLITSSAVHMASGLVDIHPTIMAVARPLHTPIHRVVRITIREEEIDCYGGIDIQVVNQKMQQALVNMKKPFMKQLPPLMLQLSPKELHESLRQLRVYKQLSHEDLNTLETCQLLSEHEQALKSAQNYQDCFLKLIQECPPLMDYLNRNLVPWPADWPGWYYPKKIIAKGTCDQLKQSVIPEQGQFHVSLNAAEDTVLIFKHFFDKLFKTVFGQDLPNKPKTYKITLCLTAVILGWIKIREKVLRKRCYGSLYL